MKSNLNDVYQNSFNEQIIVNKQFNQIRMAPKSFKKPAATVNLRPQEQVEKIKPKSAELNQNYINPIHLMSNFQLLSKMRLCIAILLGSLSGILNLNQLLAPVLYFVVQIGITPLIALKLKSYKQYFNSKSELATGITQSILMFVCSWMIVYNLVYTL